MKKKRNYDKKVKLTRILLEDYLVLKGYAQRAGVSMSEALHTIITRDWAVSHKGQPVAQPALSVTTPIALRHRLSPVIATNGNKAVAFGIKTKGVRYE
ncbi:hypothetical protein ES703_120938 [subsurface metagenome]